MSSSSPTASPLRLRLTSIQAPNADPMMVEIAALLTDFLAHENKVKLPFPVVFEFPLCERALNTADGEQEQQSMCVVTHSGSIGHHHKQCSCGSRLLSWIDRARALENGVVELGWICGLPYVLARDGWTHSIYSCLSEQRHAAGDLCGSLHIAKTDETRSSSSSSRTSSSSSSSDEQQQTLRTASLPYGPPPAPETHTRWHLIAAPVYSDLRYKSQPVYFSDVIVRHNDTRFTNFSSLCEAPCRWAYNEPHSQSGFNVTRAAIKKVLDAKQVASNQPFFSEVHRVGSHQEAIERVIDGTVDAAAIDSTVLATELERCGEKLASSIRVIDVLGPSSAPPLVTNREALFKSVWERMGSAATDADSESIHLVCDAILSGIRTALCSEDSNLDGRRQSLFARFSLAAWKPVDDGYYDSVRAMLRDSAQVAGW